MAGEDQVAVGSQAVHGVSVIYGYRTKVTAKRCSKHAHRLKDANCFRNYHDLPDFLPRLLANNVVNVSTATDNCAMRNREQPADAV